MAAPVTKEMIYEVLTSVQTQVTALRDDMTSMKAQLSSIETWLDLISSF
jgi:hypothetical protein